MELDLNMLGNAEDLFPIENEEIITESEDLFSTETEEEIKEEIKEEIDSEEVIEKDLNSEGVGEESQEDLEDEVIQTESKNNSPNFYSNLATTLSESGILTLDEKEFENITEPEHLAALFTKQIDSLLDAKQKRIDEALNYEIPVDQVKQFENVISYVNNIKEDNIKEESQEAETLRGNIIYQDYINKGFSKERAEKELKKSFDAGTDIEDAMYALEELKSFYSDEYENIIQEAKDKKNIAIKEEKELAKKIENKFNKETEPIKGIKLSKEDRTKLLNQHSKFIAKDDSGKPLNAIQKYAKENPIDYQYNINLLYYLTDGFKDLGKVINKEVKSKTNKAFKNLENTLRNPSNHLGGGLGMDFGNDKSSEANLGVMIDFE